LKLGEVGIAFLDLENKVNRGFIFRDQEDNVFVVLAHIKGRQYKCQYIGSKGIIEYHDFLDDGN
jgi:hypothetical protein